MLLELNDSMRQSCFRAVELAKQNHVLFSFDPNLRKELRNDAQMRQRMMQMLSMADVIEPTLEEARIITGCTAISDVLRALHAAGPRLVVLTRDKDGALFSFDGQVLSAEGIDVPVVDPTGAGDTFAAALACCIEKMCGWRTPSPSATAPGRWYAPSAVPSAWRSPPVSRFWT